MMSSLLIREKYANIILQLLVNMFLSSSIITVSESIIFYLQKQNFRPGKLKEKMSVIYDAVQWWMNCC